ncbi:MAG: helix-turn-helix transcriptional regulator [Geminicoccaceae bacterium]|nr:helix-turn-helix transcriptional regulator [Geminicoccaceae bacterium]
MPLPERSADLVLDVGERLAATRRALELTQEQLAEQVGVSRGALGNWEQGTRLPDPAAMLRLKQRHGVTLDWIYGGDPSGLPQRLTSRILGRTSTQ